MMQKLFNLSGKLGPLFALCLLILFIGVKEPETFFKFINIGNVIGQTSVVALAAVGMTFIIVSGGIDLSVGSAVALSGTLAAMTIVQLGTKLAGGSFLAQSVLLLSSIGVGILVGCLAGFFNGLVITQCKLPPFIVTLGMLEILRGTVLLSTNGVVVGGPPEIFSWMGNANIRIPVGIPAIAEWCGPTLIIPYSLFLLIPLALAAAFILKYTVFGVHVYSIGSNEQTARLCGVNVNKVKMWVYTLAGFTFGLAGFLQASRLRTGQPTTSIGLELDVIAAVVVGGGSLMGGEGTISGSLIGAFIIQILRNGCNLMGISPFAQRIFIGSIIIIAVFVDQLRRRAATKAGA